MRNYVDVGITAVTHLPSILYGARVVLSFPVRSALTLEDQSKDCHMN
jgi:hypothetical protein